MKPPPPKSPTLFMNSNWSFFSTTLVFIQMIFFTKPTLLGGTFTSAGISPAEGLFCISDCVSCPVICAPPPPPTKTASPPPSPMKPPPVHQYSSPPDQSDYFQPPPPSPPKTTKAFPPPSYITWGQSPTSPSPPPSPDLNYVPVPGGQGTFPSYNTGQKNSTNPYYYFYASKSSFLTLDLSFFLMVLLFSHATVWRC